VVQTPKGVNVNKQGNACIHSYMGLWRVDNDDMLWEFSILNVLAMHGIIMLLSLHQMVTFHIMIPDYPFATTVRAKLYFIN